jgi:glycosyltransferase involved in cell wall biosynthesis
MKIGVVVQRYGEEVVGGAELHARWIAEHLALRHDVEVLTTCALDYLTWANEYDAGPGRVRGVAVRRFPVAERRVAARFDPLTARVHLGAHTDEDERRWMDEHGPRTPALVDHLRAHVADYDALVFFSYRYWTTFHGLAVAPRKSVLAPTAEADATVHLRLFKEFFRLPAAYAFNTPEERELILNAAGERSLPGEVVGVGIEDARATPEDELRRRLDLPKDYVVYVGRIEKAKGCDRLFSDYIRFAHEQTAAPSLVLVGNAVLPIPNHRGIVHLGVLSDADKLGVVRAGRLLVQPSSFESLSMVLLEAWKMGRPALVNGRCDAMRGQVQRANGGLYYSSYMEFAEALRYLLGNPQAAEAMGVSGQAYMTANYSWDVVMAKYDRLLTLR